VTRVSRSECKQQMLPGCRIVRQAHTTVMLLIAFVVAMALIPSESALARRSDSRPIGVLNSTKHFSTELLLAEPFESVIAARPQRETCVSMRRIRFEPGVSLSEQPLDGPKLLLAESGAPSVRPARSGARVMVADQVDRTMRQLPADQDLQMDEGSIVLIPAGVPIRLANQTTAPAAWLQTPD
jgi:hypothetical protein